jgi:hypothetical protein
MKRLILMLAVLALAVFAALAEAAPVRYCGHYYGYSNVRERGTTCHVAHELTRAEWYNPHGIGSKYFYGFHCRGITDPNTPTNRFHCTRGTASVRFEEYR